MEISIEFSLNWWIEGEENPICVDWNVNNNPTLQVVKLATNSYGVFNLEKEVIYLLTSGRYFIYKGIHSFYKTNLPCIIWLRISFLLKRQSFYSVYITYAYSVFPLKFLISYNLIFIMNFTLKINKLFKSLQPF